MFAAMRQLLIINADVNKSDTTAALINAYKEGATEAGIAIKELAIADLKFNPNKQFGMNNSEPEADLLSAVNMLFFARCIRILSTQGSKVFLTAFLCPTRCF
jgi:putative NADPH-quinone reductase